MKNAEVRNRDLGRQTHFSPNPVHPRHHIRLVITIAHHPRLINRLQRSSIALSIQPAILVPRRNSFTVISTVYRGDTSSHRILHRGREEAKVVSVAYTGLLGYSKQYLRLYLLDHRRIL